MSVISSIYYRMEVLLYICQLGIITEKLLGF